MSTMKVFSNTNNSLSYKSKEHSVKLKDLNSNEIGWFEPMDIIRFAEFVKENLPLKD